MNATTPVYLDPLSGEEYPISEPRWRSDHGRPLSLSARGTISRASIKTEKRSLWRYEDAFPLQIEQPVTLGEGCTPLVAGMFRGIAVQFKLEWLSPSGSFKDRGSSVLISILRQQGIKEIHEDSSGNGGASMAAYAAAAKIRATILVPAGTQASKIVQIRGYGANIEIVSGNREETAQRACNYPSNSFYAGHNWHPFFLEGTKTLAYELWENLGFQAPHNVIIPTGAGSNVLGCDIGFSELLRAGEIEFLPRLFAVQPANCAPIHSVFQSDLNEQKAVTRPTIAEGAAVSNPVRAHEVVAAIRRSHGVTIAVSEEEIVSAMRDLALIGLYVEPTSACAAAGLDRLIASKTIHPDEITVVVLTGTGLKASGFWETVSK